MDARNASQWTVVNSRRGVVNGHWDDGRSHWIVTHTRASHPSGTPQGACRHARCYGDSCMGVSDNTSTSSGGRRCSDWHRSSFERPDGDAALNVGSASVRGSYGCRWWLVFYSWGTWRGNRAVVHRYRASKRC